jgi:hypothetical protein
MSGRLPIDEHVLGYWGFDEANAEDPALDDTPAARHLVVVNSPGVEIGRTGNGRQFDGSTFAYSSTLDFNLHGELSIITWVKLDEVNSTGSLLRTILCLSAEGVGQEFNTLYSLFVDNMGRLVYRHETGESALLTELKTAPSTIHTLRLQSIALRRTAVAPGLVNIELFVDNKPTPITFATVGGIASAGPWPAPTGGTSSNLCIGACGKVSDLAYWKGLIDETSIHNVARSYQPYFIAAYFRSSLFSTLNRLTTVQGLRSIAAVDIGAGIRWWTYERSGEIFVVRESPFGFFSPEVQLTLGGGTAPEIIYEPSTDTLVIVFLNGGHVLKITATGDDLPVTLNTPQTSDTAGIVKALDQIDTARFGGGASVAPALITTTRFAVQPITFTPLPSFGILIPHTFGARITGYQVVRAQGGVETVLGVVPEPPAGQALCFFAIPTRIFGAAYYVQSLRDTGIPTGAVSNYLVDSLGRVVEQESRSDILSFNRYGENIDILTGGGGGGLDSLPGQIVYVNRSPLKVALTDDPLEGGGGGGLDQLLATLTYVTRSPVKLAPQDALLVVGAGGGQACTIRRASSTSVDLL